MVVTGWHAIPWHRSCDSCAHFLRIPPNQQDSEYVLMAIWNHFEADHGIMMSGLPEDFDGGARAPLSPIERLFYRHTT